VAKRFLLLVLALVFTIMPLISAKASAMSEEQRNLFKANINYFDIDVCGAGTTPAASDAGNNKIYVIGDSLTVGMRDSGNLKSKLSNGGWSVTDIRATTGITIDDSIQKIKDDKDNAISDADTVVIGLGTNRSANPDKAVGDMLDAVDQANSNANVYWVDAYSTQDDYSDFNAVLDKYKKAGKIDKVIKWSIEARDNPGKYNLSQDSQGIHTDPAGYIKRSSWLVSQIGDPPVGSNQGGGDSQSSGDSGSGTQTDEEKIASTFNVGFSANTPKSTIERVVKKYKIGGLFIIGTNDADKDGFNKSFFNQLNTAAGHPLVIASDEEGVIQRYKYPFDFPSAKEMNKMSASSVRALGKKVGEYLSKHGVNTDLAPVVDVAQDDSGTVAGTAGRAFSDDQAEVTKKAGAFAEGLQIGGVNPVYKHFPGLGSTKGNSDLQAVTSPPLDVLKNNDLKPYGALVNKFNGAVMLDNAQVPGLTESGEVASTSPATVKLLRNDYGFVGLIMTDDLAAKGVPGSLPSAIARSLKAGAEMPLFQYTSDAGIDAAIDAVKGAGISGDVDKAAQRIQDFVAPGSKKNNTGSDKIGCCPPGDSTTLNGSTNAEKVWNYFVGKGLTNIQVASIMGNLQQESGFSTTIENPRTFAHGLGQWLGGRKTALFAKPNHDDLAVQLDFMWEELNGSYYKPTVLEPLKKATDLQTAVRIWLEHYEIPCNAGPGCNGEVSIRLPFAKTWLNKAGGGAGADANATQEQSTGSCGGGGGVEGYKDPYRDLEQKTPLRIDMGVDYAGKGPIYAIGNGVVNVVHAIGGDSGWPGPGGRAGGWVSYTLSDGPAKGKTVYFTENCEPTVKVGDKVTANTKICDLDGLQSAWSEQGWAADTSTTWAAAHVEWRAHDSSAYYTAYGENFSDLLVKLGAKPGTKQPGAQKIGTIPDGWPQWK
jgi:beta-N-acetylhexosaminidase